MAELGLGIHGEAGVEQIIYDSARQAIDAVVSKLEAEMPEGRHVALLNNLGGTSELEMSVLAAELVKSRIGDRIAFLIGPAAMMTSLACGAFRFRYAGRGRRRLRCWQVPCPMSAWPGCVTLAPETVLPLPTVWLRSRRCRLPMRKPKRS